MLKKMASDFEKMWKRKANGYKKKFLANKAENSFLIYLLVHPYESAFEKLDRESGRAECEQKMSASKESLDKLLELYQEACTDK